MFEMYENVQRILRNKEKNMKKTKEITKKKTR